VNEAAIERAMRRLAAVDGERDPAAVDTALARARAQIESLALATAELEASLPGRVGEAVREGIRAETMPVARQLAETRGLSAQAIRRLERIEGELLADRHARVDDLALLVDLISSGWRAIDERLARIESALATAGEPLTLRSRAG
jgi:hypothetical protein